MIKGRIDTYSVNGIPTYLCVLRTPRVHASCIGSSRLDALNRAWKSLDLLIYTRP